MVAISVLSAGAPIAAFATAYGNNGYDSLADRIIDKVDRIIDDAISDLPTTTPVSPPLPPTSPSSSSSPSSSPPSPTAICLGEPATIVSTSGNDNLEGTDGTDVIAPLEGDIM